MQLAGCARGLLVLVLGFVAACDITPEQRARDVCTIVCDCLPEISPGMACSDADLEECVADIGPVSDPCLDCVYANSQMCGELFTTCEDVCESNDPMTSLGGIE